MKKLFTLILVLFVFITNAQVIDDSKKLENKVARNYKIKESFKNFYKDVFKYSTLYASYSESSPLFTPETYFVTQLGDVIDVSPEKENDYAVSVGLRKIARMDYENRENRFYDGTEQNASLQSNIGNVKGLEYLLHYEKERERGEEFFNSRFFIRHTGKYHIVKLEQREQGNVNFKYQSAEVRARLPIGKKFSILLPQIY